MQSIRGIDQGLYVAYNAPCHVTPQRRLIVNSGPLMTCHKRVAFHHRDIEMWDVFRLEISTIG